MYNDTPNRDLTKIYLQQLKLFHIKNKDTEYP